MVTDDAQVFSILLDALDDVFDGRLDSEMHLWRLLVIAERAYADTEWEPVSHAVADQVLGIVNVTTSADELAALQQRWPPPGEPIRRPNERRQAQVLAATNDLRHQLAAAD